MNKLLLNSEFAQYFSVDEMPSGEKTLVAYAEKAASSAYAPYSEFKVGAAVLLNDGKIICGSNQENASYPAGLCAERVALFAASAQHPGEKIMAVAVTALQDGKVTEHSAAPCGSCRQVMAEYESFHHQPIKIIFRGDAKTILVAEGVKNLLPLMFTSENLRAKK